VTRLQEVLEAALVHQVHGALTTLRLEAAPLHYVAPGTLTGYQLQLQVYGILGGLYFRLQLQFQLKCIQVRYHLVSHKYSIALTDTDWYPWDTLNLRCLDTLSNAPFLQLPGRLPVAFKSLGTANLKHHAADCVCCGAQLATRRGMYLDSTQGSRAAAAEASGLPHVGRHSYGQNVRAHSDREPHFDAFSTLRG
jgi:hypothetical protein